MGEIGSLRDVDSIHRMESLGTYFKVPQEIEWRPQAGFPHLSLENAVLHGELNGPGIYLTLVRWYPGFMSAPHSYESDRLCMVLSGVWWINSGREFNPSTCIPVPAGSFVKRLARTPHFDGVIAEAKSPAVVAICGLAPLEPQLIIPGQPGWRRV